MTEFIVESLEDFEQAVASSERICFLFSASWDSASTALEESLQLLVKPYEGRINVVCLDLVLLQIKRVATDLYKKNNP